MNYERVRLYADFLSYGLDLEILRQIPGRVMAVTPEAKNCFMVRTVEDNFWLWLHQGREDNLTDQIALMEHCWQQGFKGFSELISLRNGRYYGKADERSWFYLTQWDCLKKVAYRNLGHLKESVSLIAAFRKSISGWSFPRLIRTKETPELLNKMKEAERYLAAFQMLAHYRLNPTQFDRLYLKILPQLQASVAESVTLLENSKYQELVVPLKPDDLVIADFSRGNIRISQDGQVRLLRIKNFRWDLPVMDLAVLLLKSGRSQHWKRSWFDAILAEYHRKVAAIGRNELAVIKAYLCFPWSIYHLINRFYLNRVAWPNYLFNDKLERLIAAEGNRIRLIAEI